MHFRIHASLFYILYFTRNKQMDRGVGVSSVFFAPLRPNKHKHGNCLDTKRLLRVENAKLGDCRARRAYGGAGGRGTTDDEREHAQKTQNTSEGMRRIYGRVTYYVVKNYHDTRPHEGFHWVESIKPHNSGKR